MWINKKRLREFGERKFMEGRAEGISLIMNSEYHRQLETGRYKELIDKYYPQISPIVKRQIEEILRSKGGGVF